MHKLGLPISMFFAPRGSTCAGMAGVDRGSISSGTGGQLGPELGVSLVRNFQIGKKTKTLDILINNAGIFGGYPQDALNTTIDQFKATYDANVYGAVRVTQAFIDLLKKSSEPRIVNVSSSQGSITLHSDPTYKYYDYKAAAYLTSKSAMNMYTVVLAYELKETNFKINAVCPGYTKTDFNGHRGPGSVEDAGKRILKYALIDNNGPSGKFFSEENNPKTGEIAW